MGKKRVNARKKEKTHENVRKIYERSENFQYIYVGQPPSQPRTSNFVPKNGAIGFASVIEREELDDEQLFAGNFSVLQKYDITVNNISFSL